MQGGPLGVSYGGITGQPKPIANPQPQPRPQPAAGIRPVAYSDLQRAPNIPQPNTPAAAGRIDSTATTRPSAPQPQPQAPQPAAQEAAPAQLPSASFSGMQREPNIPRSGDARQMPQGEAISPSAIAEGFRVAGQGVTDQLAGAGRAAYGAVSSAVRATADAATAAGQDFVAGGRAATNQIAGANDAMTYLNRGDPVKDAVTAVSGFLSRSAEQARQADYGNSGAPQQESPAAPRAAEPAASDAAESASPATATPDRQATPLEGYTYQPDPNQGPATGMSVRPTSAEGISRIDNAPGLKSPLFTNLPAGQAVSEMQGGTVNTVPAAAFQSAGPAASRETSAALQAAAARGDWDAVRGFYQRDGGTWQGRTAEQDAAESQGPRGGVIGGSGRGFNFVRRSEERAADRAQADRRARAEEGLSRDRLDIDRKRAEGEAQTRDFEVRGMQRVERLYQQLEAAETPEERAAIAEQIRALSGKDTPNRYTVVPGGQEVTEQGMLRTVPSRVLNNQTGQLVDLGGAQASRAAMPPPNHIDALKKNPNQAAQFDAIYGEGAAARYLGAN